MDEMDVLNEWFWKELTEKGKVLQSECFNKMAELNINPGNIRLVTPVFMDPMESPRFDMPKVNEYYFKRIKSKYL